MDENHFRLLLFINKSEKPTYKFVVSISNHPADHAWTSQEIQKMLSDLMHKWHMLNHLEIPSDKNLTLTDRGKLAIDN